MYTSPGLPQLPPPTFKERLEELLRRMKNRFTMIFSFDTINAMKLSLRRMRSRRGTSSPRQFDRRKRLKLINTLLTVAIVGILGSIIMTVIVFAYFSKDLPSPSKLTNRDVSQSTKIYDRNGKLLFDIYGDKNRTLVQYDDIPLYLRQATVAIEDKDFDKHKGFELRGWLRAAYEIVVHRDLQGGSTLTQQLVKKALLSDERTITRKIKEFILAIQVERRYTKKEILQMYLNEVPYGGTAWGVSSAAQTYFGKDVKDLNLAESAFIAGLPQSPSRYSPFGSRPELGKERQKAVLRRMLEDGYINKEQHDMAVNMDLKFSNQTAGIKAPHFVMYVREKLVDQFGEAMVQSGGLKVTTTLDLDVQEAAQEVVKTNIEKLAKLKVGNGGAIVINPNNGEVLAMVGSKDYFGELAPKDCTPGKNCVFEPNVNVTTSLRQPGSSIKPLVYATGFKQGYTPSTMIMDVETKFPGGADHPEYIPVNYDGKFHGPQQVRFALGNSYNIPAVKMLAMVGMPSMFETARDMGITTFTDPSRYGLSLALGGGEVKLLEHTGAFGVFATGGVYHEQATIMSVEDPKGRSLFKLKPTQGRQALSKEVSYLISSILSDNGARTDAFGPNSVLNIPGKTVAVKTGTTNDKRDNWTVGYTRSYAVGVWVGNNDNSAMDPRLSSGITGAAPIWSGIMKYLLKDKPNEPFEKTDNIVEMDVDSVSGYQSHDGFPSRKEVFEKGKEPTGKDPIHVKVKVCKDNGKLATPIDIDKGNVEEREFFVLKEKDPTDSTKNRWQEGIDAWIAGNGDARYHPPTEQCDSKDEVIVKIIEPQDKQQVDSRDFDIKADVISNSDIVRVEFRINGNLVNTTSSKPYVYHVTNLIDGTYEIKVRATNAKGADSETTTRIGVFVPWNQGASESAQLRARPLIALTPGL